NGSGYVRLREGWSTKDNFDPFQRVVRFPHGPFTFLPATQFMLEAWRQYQLPEGIVRQNQKVFQVEVGKVVAYTADRVGCVFDREFMLGGNTHHCLQFSLRQAWYCLRQDFGVSTHCFIWPYGVAPDENNDECE